VKRNKKAVLKTEVEAAIGLSDNERCTVSISLWSRKRKGTCGHFFDPQRYN